MKEIKKDDKLKEIKADKNKPKAYGTAPCPSQFKKPSD